MTFVINSPWYSTSQFLLRMTFVINSPWYSTSQFLLLLRYKHRRKEDATRCSPRPGHLRPATSRAQTPPATATTKVPPPRATATATVMPSVNDLFLCLEHSFCVPSTLYFKALNISLKHRFQNGWKCIKSVMKMHQNCYEELHFYTIKHWLLQTCFSSTMH
jgi:hypothetical protein